MARFEQQRDFAERRAAQVNDFHRGAGSVDGHLAAGAEAAVEIVEIGQRPTVEEVRLLAHDDVDHRVRAAIEHSPGQQRRVLEQFVGVDAEAAR